MNKYKVYMHICPNGKKYIGITQQDVLKRWNYGNGYKGCVLFYKAIKKYGWKNIKHIILFDNLEKCDAEQKEIELIKHYKTNERKYGYNICSGGQGTPNHIVSKEIRIKISENTKKAMNNPNIKEKLKQCHLGKTLSEEHKAKIRLSARKYQTEKTKEKMREINKNKIKVKCIETNMIFNSLQAAADYIGYSSTTHISGCAMGKRKSAGGYHWRFV